MHPEDWVIETICYSLFFLVRLYESTERAIAVGVGVGVGVCIGVCVAQMLKFLARLYESTGRAIAITQASASA